MTAIFSGYFSVKFFLVSSEKLSPRNRLSQAIAIGDSMLFRLHFVSQGWVQMRPHAEGKGFLSRTSRNASLKRPLAMS
jgi:hypothetical protein